MGSQKPLRAAFHGDLAEFRFPPQAWGRGAGAYPIRPPSSSSIWMRTIVLELASGLNPSASARFASNLRGQPATIFSTNGSGSRRMRATTASPATLRERGDLLGHRHGQTRHGQRPARAHSACIQRGGVAHERHRCTRPGVPVHDAVGHRQHRLLAGQGLADDVGEEPGGRLVGARPAARSGAAAAGSAHRGSPCGCSRRPAARRSPSASRRIGKGRGEELRRRSPRGTARQTTQRWSSRTRSAAPSPAARPASGGARVPSRLVRSALRRSPAPPRPTRWPPGGR